MSQLPLWIKESTRVTLCFGVVFFGASFLTGLHGWRVPIHLPWESAIPFVPPLALIYLSIGPAMTAVAFALRSKPSALVHFRKVLIAEILIAGACFLLLPAQLAPGYARTAPAPWSHLVAASVAVGMPYNLFPSLHVAFGLSTAWHGASDAPKALRAMLALWAALVVASTLLLHLHHVLDVLGGVLLAGLVEYRYRSSISCSPSTPSPQA